MASRCRLLLRSEERRGSEEHTSELQSPWQLVCRLLLEKRDPQPLEKRTFLLYTHRTFSLCSATGTFIVDTSQVWGVVFFLKGSGTKGYLPFPDRRANPP